MVCTAQAQVGQKLSHGILLQVGSSRCSRLVLGMMREPHTVGLGKAGPFPGSVLLPLGHQGVGDMRQGGCPGTCCGRELGTAPSSLLPGRLCLTSGDLGEHGSSAVSVVKPHQLKVMVRMF